MTKKLEELFELPQDEDTVAEIPAVQIESEDVPVTATALANLERIESALPAVKGLEAADTEIDELVGLAKESYEDLMNLGMQVDSRYASEIFAVAGTMLGHAITAKTAKVNKKLRQIDLQLKHAKLKGDQLRQSEDTGSGQTVIPTAEGVILDRNELMRRLKEGEVKH